MYLPVRKKGKETDRILPYLKRGRHRNRDEKEWAKGEDSLYRRRYPHAYHRCNPFRQDEDAGAAVYLSDGTGGREPCYQ